MDTSESAKVIFEVTNEMPLKDFLDGTSARTRPLSYNEIILRRKEKGGKAQQDSNISGAADSKLAQDYMDSASDVPNDNQLISDNSKPVDANKNSNDSKKVRSGRKADTSANGKNEIFVQDGRLLNPDGKSKDKGDKIGRYNRVPEETFSREKADILIVNSDYGLDKRKDSESYKSDRVCERSRIKSEIVKAQPYNEERQAYRKRKTDKRIGSDSDDDYKKRNRKGVRQTDNSNTRGSDKSSKEKKHKHYSEDKSRNRNNVEKNEGEGTELSKTHLGESRSKRRWSRSKDCDKVRGRRSLSLSPKAFKYTSKCKRELVETSSQSTKDKSGREHSNIDNKRISSNGSNSHYRRNSNTSSSSGLGGYSPRKRKTEAAAKTPSPTHRSPERKNAGWDSQPVEKESAAASSTLFNLNATTQKLSLNIMEYPSITTLAPTTVNPIGISLHTLTTQVHAVETIQLTQATRPKRRLYVENLPVSASEKDLIECFNKLLMSSGVNYIQGKQPCISCTIHKEKSQALVEFLTPEDASAALSFDGMCFSGSNLKLRRPKDYANVNTGISDKSVGSVDSIYDIVEDSPHKIFVGGISKLFSSRMLLEIARAFGPVKAFHFEFIADNDEPCAFLEYVDHSVTLKACAGLNGMKLGGQVLTAVLATPEHVLENGGKLPIYKFPKHAKPLLKKPRTILKLKNVINPEYPVPLSESELEEILDDIRLECSRFGIVRSVNVAKKTSAFSTLEDNEIKSTSACNDVNGFDFTNRSHRVQLVNKSTGFREIERSEPLEPEKEPQSVVEKNGCNNIAGLSDILRGSVEPEDTPRSRLVGESLFNQIISGNTVEDEARELPFKGEDISLEEIPIQSNPGGIGESGIQRNSSEIELVSNSKNANSISVMNDELEYKPSAEALKSEVHNAKLLSSEEEVKIGAEFEIDRIDQNQLDAPGECHDRKDAFVDLGHILEPGSVIVEYRRLEAACIAAHCLQGRIFDGRVVSVEYVDEKEGLMM